jgi:hypothetical protein
MGKLAQEIIRQAGDQLGVVEATGNNDGVAVESYLKSVGLGKGYAWCMAFVYWCVKQAANKLGLRNPLKQTGGVLDEWQSGRGVHLSVPEQGCIFIMHHPSGYHTGIVTGVFPNGVLHTIEGNTNSDGSREGTSVLRKTRNVSDMIGFIRLEDIPLS